MQGPICRGGGWGLNPPNDFLALRVSVDLSSWGVDGAENVAFLMIFSLCYSHSVTLKYATNAFAAGAPPRTPLGELTTLPQTL